MFILPVHSITIENNYFENGSLGVWITGPFSGPGSNVAIVRNNYLLNQGNRGIGVSYFRRALISDNYIDGQGSGINLGYCDTGAVVIRNEIHYGSGSGILFNLGNNSSSNRALIA